MKLKWLGQSGFILSAKESTVACDLYLSDYCQEKSRLDHTRKMPIPIEPSQLNNIDHYLITHGHIDHFDPKTVAPILHASEKIKFYCPPDCEKLVDDNFENKKDRFTFLNSFKKYKIGEFELVALPAAHEQLDKDDSGEYIAYSYLLIFHDLKKTIFFGGDTIPYEKQLENVSKNVPVGYKLTLIMPVNGRDLERATLGFKGNFTINENIKFYKELGAELIIPCHFGMFELNDLKDVNELSAFEDSGCNCIVPEINVDIEI